MKTINALIMLSLSVMILAGCNKKDEDTKELVGSFMLKGEKFEIYSEDDQPTGILQIFHDQADDLSEGSFTISGLSETHIGSIQIGIEYKTSTGISGTYLNGDFSAGNHLFDPWLSSYSYTSLSGTSMITGNEPEGTLTINKNSSGLYTVNFSFIYSDSTVASGNIKQNYTVQEVNF